MNKTFLASAIALALMPAAFAQTATPSTVTLYGLVDAGVMRVTGLRGGSQTHLTSGIMEGTRWGLRGAEDLGGGYRAIFTLESRVEADTGTTGTRPLSGLQLPDRLANASALGLPATAQAAITGAGASLANAAFGVNLNNALFDRQAFLGLITPFGGFLAGRQYTPAYEIIGTYDAMKTESSLSAGQVASLPGGVDIRLSNTLAYRLTANQFSAVAMYGFGESQLGGSDRGRFYGLGGQYKSEAFSAGIGYNTRNNELGQKSLTTAGIGATVAIGPGNLSALYADVQNDNPTGLSTLGAGLVPSLTAAGLSPAVAAATGTAVQAAFTSAFRQDGRLMHVGYRFKLHEQGSLTVAYSRYDDRTRFDADTSSYGLAYTYALSKRTDFNVVLTHFDNRGFGQAAPGQAGFLGGVTDRAGTDSNSFAIGLRHRF
jgi:predicted porin